MYRLLFLLILFTSFNSVAQIKSNGFKNFNWGQDKSSFTSLKNCSNKLTGTGFENCDIVNSDSLFYKTIKYKYISARFFQNKLSELQFDINHHDLSYLIAELSKELGTPAIREKKLASIDGDEPTIGYVWNIGDTHLLIINDGKASPAIAVLSSKKIKSQYPASSLSLEKLIFE
jgi:hypothetical protein